MDIFARLTAQTDFLYGFLTWFKKFFGYMLDGILTFFKGIFNGIVKVFDFGYYFKLWNDESVNFGALDWTLSILAFIVTFAIWLGVIALIFLAIRKYIRFRRTVTGNEDLLEEIADLHQENMRLNNEKQKLLELKTGKPGDSGQGLPEEPEEETEEEADKPATYQGRFARLEAVDRKYDEYVAPNYYAEMSLSEMCDDLRLFACSRHHLYYDIRTIRLMIAGLASTKLIILQGISGTGKTSLPYVMGKYFLNDTTIASVQPSWRDRNELFGYFNEFTKKFNETDVLRRIYESSYNDDLNIIVLDEMNIARVEYYFAEMLSILEMPNPAEWRIELVPSSWKNDPARIQDGCLQIPQNVWYVGTINNDDSTFSVSDKVYDRALVINLDSKGIPFDAPDTDAKRVPYTHVEKLYKEAFAKYPVSQKRLEDINKLDLYVIEHFRVAFGNRIMKQLKLFVPAYIACGGDELDGVDYILATKVFRKFESLNLALIRDEIRGLIQTLDSIFGKGKMKESIAYLQRLQKTY